MKELSCGSTGPILDKFAGFTPPANRRPSTTPLPHDNFSGLFIEVLENFSYFLTELRRKSKFLAEVVDVRVMTSLILFYFFIALSVHLGYEYQSLPLNRVDGIYQTFLYFHFSFLLSIIDNLLVEPWRYVEGV